MYLKKFFASFVLTLGLGIVAVSLAGLGSVAVADWIPVGGGGGTAGCTSHDACVANPSPCTLSGTGCTAGGCDTAKAGCEDCSCQNIGSVEDIECKCKKT